MSDDKHNGKADYDGEEEDSKIFPQRLMEILTDEQFADAICWLPHGKAFIIRNRQLFADQVMPKFFSRKAKYSSFTRKLNRWNFVRVSSGPELGAYYHEYFLRDKPHLAAQMFCKNARSKLAMADEPQQPKQESPQQQQVQAPAAAQKQQQQQPQQQIPSIAEEPKMSMQHQQQQQQLMPPVQPVTSGYNIPDFVLAALRKEGEGDAALSMAAAPTLGVSNLQLLERQIQIMQEEHQRLLLQQMATRRLQEQQLQEQLQRQCTIQSSQAQYQQQPGGTKPNPESIMRMKQLMELRARQRKGLAPSNGRASAA
mmetsp:Transcript_35067/g.73034  ORF Transcript_35067/g.73034 Transcript_35067/m.73034 type:complete len:312 (-) Transcript_35067:1016-1951(-)|eukprot:CAMPEP_0172453412 /NCGR_PEP_ID=MMETSP1065-20121228/10745_1 /TAXON_ID=265537 /ORGANISM="Amphiprora paludosa, Strain CCMP125" /LENGTH=311 /DNA_ID=CAMNT_0013205591 /DNA_START=25 /DNA_END=960 /DNA_ORIENTATION=+